MILKAISECTNSQLISFSCGNKALDQFLKKYALKNHNNGYGKTFILEDSNNIIGYFTLSSAQIKFTELPSDVAKNIPKYPIPAIRIARLAVDEKYTGKGYGKHLLKEAFTKIVIVSNTIGVRLIVVDAKETSQTFYEQFGFKKLMEGQLTYYLPIETLMKAFLEANNL